MTDREFRNRMRKLGYYEVAPWIEQLGRDGFYEYGRGIRKKIEWLQCVVCGHSFPARRNHPYCSNACRQKAYRMRPKFRSA
jgi:ferredoxin